MKIIGNKNYTSGPLLTLSQNEAKPFEQAENDSFLTAAIDAWENEGGKHLIQRNETTIS